MPTTHQLTVQSSRTLATQARQLIGRLQVSLAATRERIQHSHRNLEHSRVRRLDSRAFEPLGGIGRRIQMLAGSVDELHSRLGIEVSAAADELQSLLALTDELGSLAEFCARIDENSPAASHSGPARHCS